MHALNAESGLDINVQSLTKISLWIGLDATHARLQIKRCGSRPRLPPRITKAGLHK